GKLLKYCQLLCHPDYQADWSKSSANEFGHLANGVGGHVKGTNTICFIQKQDIPGTCIKDIIFGQFVCKICTEKKAPNCTRLVVGGDRINYPCEVATPTTDMYAAKILFNSVISTIGTWFMTMDISNFYLNTPLAWPEYIRMSIHDIPEEIPLKYKLPNLLAPDNCIYIKIVLSMYELPHSGLIANELLKNNSTNMDITKVSSSLGFKHEWHPVWFALVVDDFGIKYFCKEHSLHLQSIIESYYPLSANWTGDCYIGIMLDWDYMNKKVHLSMPGYVAKVAKLFKQKCPTAPQHSLFPTKPIIYGAKK
ncbi:hypothetical protein ACHAW6_001168, partial [Cyclotella cf. meneghiniana]